MSLQEYKAKAAVTGDIGEGLAKDLAHARVDALQQEGGSKYIKEAIPGVEKLVEHMRRDMESGAFNTLEPKGVFEVLVRYNLRAVECLRNFADKCKADSLVSHGRAKAFSDAIGLVQNHHTSAVARAQHIIAAQEEAAKPVAEQETEEAARARRKARAPGEHPGRSPLDARRAAVKKPKKPRKCGLCGKTGHIATGCPSKKGK